MPDDQATIITVTPHSLGMCARKCILAFGKILHLDYDNCNSGHTRVPHLGLGNLQFSPEKDDIVKVVAVFDPTGGIAGFIFSVGADGAKLFRLNALKGVELCLRL